MFLFSRRTFTAALAAATIAMAASSAMAGNEPWNSATPQGTTAAHQQMAAQAHKVLTSVPESQLAPHPLSITWTNRYEKVPLSNISKQELNKALVGRYFVYNMYTRARDNSKNDWAVMYFAKDGKTHMCQSKGGGKRHKQVVYDRYLKPGYFGLSGMMHWGSRGYRSETPDHETNGWPMVGNSSTGQLAIYSWDRGEWKVEAGWLQNDYAAAFAKYCSKLPRAGALNPNQTGRSISEIARGAHAYGGFKTAFQNDPNNPLTAGMYYHLYPPAR